MYQLASSISTGLRTHGKMVQEHLRTHAVSIDEFEEVEAGDNDTGDP